MKKMVKRATALLFVLIMVMSMMAVSASAAYKSRTVYGGSSVRAQINTGKSTSNWRTYTMIIVRNTGSKSIYVWAPVKNANYYVNGATVSPNTSRVFYVTGNYTNYYVTIQGSGGTSKVEVSTVERGNVYL